MISGCSNCKADVQLCVSAPAALGSSQLCRCTCMQLTCSVLHCCSGVKLLPFPTSDQQRLSRSERSKSQIVSDASWKLLFDRVDELPATIQHIVVVPTVPVLYPKVCLLGDQSALSQPSLGKPHCPAVRE